MSSWWNGINYMPPEEPEAERAGVSQLAWERHVAAVCEKHAEAIRFIFSAEGRRILAEMMGPEAMRELDAESCRPEADDNSQ